MSSVLIERPCEGVGIVANAIACWPCQSAARVTKIGAVTSRAAPGRLAPSPYRLQHGRVDGGDVVQALKSELVWRTIFYTRQPADQAIGRYIDGFYNPVRRHSALDFTSPAQFEKMAAE
jgi:transposase InsO family protein